MPQMDGFKTTQLIIEKCLKHQIEKPVIVALTANSDGDDLRERCEQNGFQRYYQKPIKPHHLQELFEAQNLKFERVSTFNEE